jgi:hypothetical protein
MYDVLVLVCSLAATPKLGDCTVDTAVTALRLPEPVAMVQGCSMMGQAYLAQTEFGRTLAAGEVVKVTCRRTRPLPDSGPALQLEAMKDAGEHPGKGIAVARASR